MGRLTKVKTTVHERWTNYDKILNVDDLIHGARLVVYCVPRE